MNICNAFLYLDLIFTLKPPQPAIACLNLTIETPEQRVKYV